MIKKYNEHIAYLENDDADPNEILDVVGIPSGLYYGVKRKNYSKIESRCSWSNTYKCYVYRDKDLELIQKQLGLIGDNLTDNETFLLSELKKMKIENYQITNNEEVIVFDDVIVEYYSGKRLPFKFGKIHGNFKFVHGGLETLDNCPDIVLGDFNVSFNRLCNLDGGPSRCHGIYNCSHNNLTSLRGSPKETLSFNCSYNELESLTYGPFSVRTNFNCSHNQLKDLRYSPNGVDGDFDCSYNKITDFSGVPRNCKNVISLNQKI